MTSRLLVALLLSATSVASWAQDPVGAEFQVNNYTTGDQAATAMAWQANWSFVVVWQSDVQDGSGNDVFGQRFNASGVSQGSEFWVNTYATGFQGWPSVAADLAGNFVVVWDSASQDGSNDGVFGQRFNASGVPQGGEFQVNTYTAGWQDSAAVASGAVGNFVVVWQSYLQDGSSWGVFGQRFDAAGLPQGGEFRVNSYTTYAQRDPSVAADLAGNFIVVWGGVFGKRFNASGVSLGSEFRVNSYTTGSGNHPAVASAANGSFVVVWQSEIQDGSDAGVFGQRFNASGVSQGSEFRVNSYTTGHQGSPAVASDATGNFVVVWRSYGGQDGSGWGVFGQRFNAFGVPRGAEFRVNSYTTGHQSMPAVSSAPNGNFVVVWTDYSGQDGDWLGVFGQRYGDLIFKDGFQAP